MCWNSSEFMQFSQKANYDDILVTYSSNEPKDDFIICDKNDNVTELIPKKVVSNIATVWVYF